MSPSERHLDPETISELDEGLLAPETSAAAGEHLARCEGCRRVHEALTEVRDVLRLDDPGPMPEGVAAALENALSAGAQLRTTRTRRRHPVSRVGLAAAAIVLVATGTGLGLQAVTGDQGATPQSASAGQERKPLAEPRGEAAGAPLTAADAPGHTYTTAGFDRQVRTLLEIQDVHEAARAREAADLGCTGWAGDGRRILAVDQGTFEGRPVTVAVRADARGPDTHHEALEAVIVPRNCAPPGDPLYQEHGIARP
ncbi:MAG: hypothetical protein ACRDPK_17355 [Carbonactinosporaceae bacterium]